MGIFSMTQSLSFASKIFDNRNSTEPMIKMMEFKPSLPREYKSVRLERAIPEEQGIPSRKIHAFIKRLAEDKTLNMHNVTVVRNGKILCEASFGAQKTDIWKYTFSACKSVLSLAIGLLIDDGVIHPNDRVIDVFPKEISALAKLKLKDLNIEDLLTMRSPVMFSEIDSAIEEDWIRSYFSAPLQGDVGEDFRYNSLNTYILSAIVARKSGMSVSELLQERLFTPLGIASDAWYWEKCPKGIEKGGWGLFIYPEDFCKLGQLVMQKGRWNGKQLISEDYITAATTAHVAVSEESSLFDYGYQMWVGKNTQSFLFNGMLGQNLIGFKNNGVIVMCNAGNGEFFHTSNLFTYLIEAFAMDFPETLPTDAKAAKALSDYVLSLSAYCDTARPRGLWERILSVFNRKMKREPLYPKEWQAICGTKWQYFSGHEKAVGLLPLVLQAVENCYPQGFSCISFEQNGELCILHYEENGNCFNIPLGIKRPITTELSFGENKFLVAAQAKFKQDEDDRQVLVIRLDFLEFPCSRLLKLILLNDNSVLLRQEELPGKDFALDIIRDQIEEFSDKPLISGILDRIGGDFFEFKAERSFAPELILKRTIEKNDE